MPVCGIDATHTLNEWWRKNELGRWYECETCGSTVLVPTLKYKSIVLWMRARRRLGFQLKKLATRRGNVAN